MGFQPSGLFGFLEIDFKGEADTGRLTLNHVFSTPINQVFCLDMGVDATLNFEMTLEIDGVDGLRDVDLLVEDRHHELVVVLHHRALSSMKAMGLGPTKAKAHAQRPLLGGVVKTVR